ncbi:transcriptional regulator [Curtobacterium sp. MCLR17_036]|uniref:GbsR/MarR family transcriptional regulator n=1 Tax=Curtobacterium sp. MCLR17_036 TaxID=2175620 RepID=UPI000DAA54EA|nr:MarR family transcriptional regulator [Curtobacterium sp. MCLR17_036]WIE66006.1 transcriptional regulator [Curtobacterium sp. MCLR17_036]
MTGPGASTGDTGGADDRLLEPERQAFVEEFALMLNDAAGMPLTDARVLGYLLVTRAPHSSSADLQAALGASSGSISMATRRLVETGFVKRHTVPGERSHYFRAEADVWGSWLAGERKYLDRQRDVIGRGLAIVESAGRTAAGDVDAEVRERLLNGRDYMQWLQGYHHEMLQEWEAFKAARDDTDRSETP